MPQSELIKELVTALCKAQGRFGIAEFDCTNPHFKSRYASLTSVMNVVRKPLADEGLSIVQIVEETDVGMFLETKLFHSSGQWLTGRMPLFLSKKDMQGLGSAVTYAKRYAIAAMLGVVSDDDDDGNAAVVTTKVVTTPLNKPPKNDSVAKPRHVTELWAFCQKVKFPGDSLAHLLRSEFKGKTWNNLTPDEAKVLLAIVQDQVSQSDFEAPPDNIPF